jgi:diaminopimelate decarboxylase
LPYPDLALKLNVLRNRLRWGGVDCIELVERFGSPLFVYDAGIIREQARRLRQAITWPETRILYSCKANSNLALLRLLREEQVGLDAVSPGEVFLARRAGFKPSEMLFTGNNVTDDEMRYIMDRKVLINIDSLSQLERFGRIWPGGTISVRINPAVGGGHHEHVITGGPESKFGIWVDHLGRLRRIAKKFNLRIIGLHQHIGSGIMQPEIFLEAMEVMLGLARDFPGLEFLDFGGGLGVPQKKAEKPLDVARLGQGLSRRFEKFCQRYGRRLTMILESGRYLVAESGVLLTRVNTIKVTPGHTFVGTDSGFNNLIRHPLYRAHHEIVNASRVSGRRRMETVAGNLCESGDLFTHGREITAFREGDIAAILNAGAYGFAMSMQYNSRPRPPEVMVSDGEPMLIRRRETFASLIRGQVIPGQSSGC